MNKSKLLDPRNIELDMNNPRFSLFNFENENEVVEYLFKYEDIKTLALQIVKNGYITLGERIIVLESLKNGNKNYVVLEGNRRIAALKIIFTEKNRFSSADRKRIEELDVKDFFVDCDVVDEKDEDEARFKITAKHIDGIKVWNPTDKRVFYDNLFTQYRANGNSSNDALNAIERVTPETKAKIRNALRSHRFISLIYNEVKSVHPQLDYLSHLDTDVLLSRVQQRVKGTLQLKEDEDFFLKCKKGKEDEFKAILLSLGEATWINKTLNTRTFSTKNMWNKILNEDKVIPGLDRLIQDYNNKEEAFKEPVPETKDGSSTENRTNSNHIERDKDSNSKQEEGAVSGVVFNDQEEIRNKYKMFISDQNVRIKSLNYDLTENIDILDEKSNHISKSSSVFQNVVIWSEDSNIAIKNNRILSLSENGKYIIKVKFFDTEKSFSIFLRIPRQRKKQEEYKDMFSDNWFDDSVALLSEREEYSNIVSVLNCLNENKNLSSNIDNIVMLSFLIRILIEYSSKAYWDKYRAKQQRPDTLSKYVSNISTYLYSQKIISKEQKKAFSNGKDLETLNSQIHDYRSNISSISIETIFKSYKPYLDTLFLELNK